MDAKDIAESVEYATKILQFMRNNKPSDVAISYLACFYIVCTHALSMSDMDCSLDNTHKLLIAMNDAIKTEVGRMISERNGNG
jgi:hypothetical protein